MKCIKFNEFLDESNMKPSHGDINESSKFTGNIDQVFTKLETGLIELSKIIKAKNGSKIDLKLEIKTGRRDQKSFRIYSDNIIDQMGTLGKGIFKEVKLDFWGGEITDNSRIWFSPNVLCSHIMGGSSEASFIWNRLWFDYQTGKWIFEEA